MTGLDDVREWMTLEYIANSTGVSAETIITKLGLEALLRAESGQTEVSIYQPLMKLAADARYPRGPRGLSEDIKAVLSQHVEEGQ